MKINLSHPDLTNPIQRFLILLLFIILLLILMVIKGNAQTQGGQSLIDKLATDYVTDSHNHALNIGIIRNGKQEVFTFGETERGKGEKPKSNAIFELGTSTEVFTTSLMAILESEGKLSSLDLVADVLKGKVTVPYYQRIICTPPQFNVPMAPEDRAFSRGNVCYPDPNDAPQAMVLCDLATHSAGLPSEPPYNIFNTKNPYANYTTERLNRYVGNLPPNQAFGFQYNHSLIGMGLLGQALSIKSGKDYETLLKEKILTPLSMTNTFIKPTPEQAALFLTGHNSKGKSMIHRDYNALIPAAGIRSSVPDLLQFLNANLSKGIPTEKTDTRFNIALGETHRPRLFTDPADWKYMIGWGWISSIGIPSEKPLSEKSGANPENGTSRQNREVGKKRVYWRCGEQGGFATFIGFIKDSNIGVVVLSNTANRVEDMGMKILEYLESVPATASVR